MEDKKGKSKFKKFLIVYTVILVICMMAFLWYVADSLMKYEANQIDNYMESAINKIIKDSVTGKIEEYIDVSEMKISEFEKNETTISQGFEELFINNKITYKLNEESKSEEKLIYNIYANEELILEVELNGSQKENRLGLLTFEKWKIEKITSKMENGLYTCNILVPNNYSVYINDQKLSEGQMKEKVQEDGLEQISKYVEIPYVVKYEITNLLKQPNVKILDENNKNVECKFEGNTISEILEFEKIENAEDAVVMIKNKPDIMQVAKNWSLYLTDDLSGRLHGFYNINKYLIKDSEIYKYAYNWATGVDITFVSSHTLENPRFTDEVIKNFEIYNENAFSCEVYLQKNMRLKSGKRIEDKMHEKMYFAYYDDTQDNIDNPTWKLVNMQSIIDK